MNKETPLVSIIIPVYNVADYIRPCLDSALAQTYKNLQIITVDDGSPDECGNICEEYAKRDSRIEVVHKENGGLSSARNAGLLAAKGEYIYFFDSDDLIENNLIERCLETMIMTESDVVVFNYDRVPNGGKSPEFHKAREIVINSVEERKDFICNVLCKHKIGWESWGRFFNAKVIFDNGLLFEDNKKVFAEDFHFMLQVACVAKKVFVIEDILYHYTIRGDSIMGKVSYMPFDKFPYLFDSMGKFMDKISNLLSDGNSIMADIMLRQLDSTTSQLRYAEKSYVESALQENSIFFSEIIDLSKSGNDKYRSKTEAVLLDFYTAFFSHNKLKCFIMWNKYYYLTHFFPTISYYLGKIHIHI